MKKALFLLHIPPPVHGSSVVGKYIHNSRIINSSFEIKYINLLLSRKIEHTGRINLIKICRFLIVCIKLIYSLLIRKYDICYFALSVNGVAFIKDTILIFILKLFGIKIVFHLHNKGISTNKKSKLNYNLYKFVFSNSEVITLSDLLYYDIDEFVEKNKTHVCFNGIEKIIEKTELIEKNNLVPRILFLGNLIEAKGIFVLLEACALLNARKVEFICNFVGGEADVTVRQFKRKKRELGLTEEVHYLGKKYGAEKANALNNADILAFPTYYDCFPLVLLEALQFGLPVVSTFEGGIRDIIIDGVNGYVVPQKDIEAFADKLEILIKDAELRKRMGEAGRKKYEQQFALEIFENRLVEILNQVLEK